MKKKTAFLTALFGLIAMPFASATVPDEQIALDGIAPGAAIDDVKAKYPAMRRIDGDSYLVADGFVVEADEYRPKVVEEVKVYSNNKTVKTTAGVGVGLPESELNSAYGTADKIDRDRYEVEYIYYNDSHTLKMKFKVVNDIIQKITCELKN